MPMRSNLAMPAERRDYGATAEQSGGDWFATTSAMTEFVPAAGFCALGLCVTFCLIHFFPNFGAIVTSIDLFP